MSDLTEFLLARIAEDEAVARTLLVDLERQVAAGDYPPDERGPLTPSRMLAAQLWAHYDGQTRDRNFARGQAVASLADPVRALAECEAKRRIVEQAAIYADAQYPDFDGGYASASEDAIRALALPYADHPDYDEEWKP